MTDTSIAAQPHLSTADAALIPTETPGIAVANRSFDAIVAALRSALLTLSAPQQPVSVAVPPVIARALLERVGYVDGFPNLLGTVHSFAGSPARWHELQLARDEQNAPWHTAQQITDVAVLPATCYHLYPLFEGKDLTEPVVVTAEAYCYRNEGTHEHGRLRSFRMREFVRIGVADEVTEWRDAWVARAERWLGDLGLDVSVVPASDPFFGGAGRLMGATQREQQLKWELTAPVGDGAVQAVASANYHKDHFGTPFSIRIGGETAHTACAAFGLERITLALLAAHGPDPASWPARVRATLAVGPR
ncbi:aminoacyl--tRNA ligase-related protein [Micromonospora sp. NPDC049048]|uniref:aminoacyl--tRNA ligase-related protein n=1 Tax=Micromonospora sp. NPDC049048 TaxID=3364263 RepID=UPI003723B013